MSETELKYKAVEQMTLMSKAMLVGVEALSQILELHTPRKGRCHACDLRSPCRTSRITEGALEQIDAIAKKGESKL